MGDRTQSARGRTQANRTFLKTPYQTARSSTSKASTQHSATGTPPSRASMSASTSPRIQVGNHTLPAFVQVETLHPGQAFGLRACLDPEERGPSVSLVSGECEILQINKKFFMKH